MLFLQCCNCLTRCKDSNYLFDERMLALTIYPHLKMLKQKTNYSDWTEDFQGIPQGSILGPLSFNKLINDISFLFKNQKFVISWITIHYIIGKNQLQIKQDLNYCDGVVLKIYLDHKFQWLEEGWTANLLHTK